MDQGKRKIISLVKKRSVERDWEQAFGGKSKGNRHLGRVNEIANFLQKKEGGNQFFVLAESWVHDVSLVSGNDSNPIKIYSETKNFLEEFKSLSNEEIEKIANDVSSHEKGNKKISLEAKIVHDADVIDKSGFLGIIRHIWKMTNMINNQILEGEKDLLELQNHLVQRKSQLFTKTAKQIIKKFENDQQIFFKNKPRALKIMKDISKMALFGLTSENIAKKMMKNRSGSAFLKSQLTCDYLR